jgi:hypothetical protein
MQGQKRGEKVPDLRTEGAGAASPPKDHAEVGAGNADGKVRSWVMTSWFYDESSSQSPIECAIRSAWRSLPKGSFRSTHRRDRVQWIVDQNVDENARYYKRKTSQRAVPRLEE